MSFEGSSLIRAICRTCSSVSRLIASMKCIWKEPVPPPAKRVFSAASCPQIPMALTAYAAAGSRRESRTAREFAGFPESSAGKAAARAAASMPSSIQPLPVIRLIMGWPFSTSRKARPSVIRSLGPVMTTRHPAARARRPACLKASCCSLRHWERSASTPFSRGIEGLSGFKSRFSSKIRFAKAVISETFPRMAVQGISSKSWTAASIRKGEAPTPTGSSTMGWPSRAAVFPALFMAAREESLKVPRFITMAWLRAAISFASPSWSAIMGEAPAASRRFATSRAVT